LTLAESFLTTDTQASNLLQEQTPGFSTMNIELKNPFDMEADFLDGEFNIENPELLVYAP
jgi:hypothetical protein